MPDLIPDYTLGDFIDDPVIKQDFIEYRNNIKFSQLVSEYHKIIADFFYAKDKGEVYSFKDAVELMTMEQEDRSMETYDKLQEALANYWAKTKVFESDEAATMNTPDNFASQDPVNQMSAVRTMAIYIALCRYLQEEFGAEHKMKSEADASSDSDKKLTEIQESIEFYRNDYLDIAKIQQEDRAKNAGLNIPYGDRTRFENEDENTRINNSN